MGTTHHRIQYPHGSSGRLFMMTFLPLALVIFGVHVIAAAWGVHAAAATSPWMLRDLRTTRTTCTALTGEAA